MDALILVLTLICGVVIFAAILLYPDYYKLCLKENKTPKFEFLAFLAEANEEKRIKFIAIGITVVVVGLSLAYAISSGGGSKKSWSDLSDVEKENARYSHELYEYIHGRD